MTSFFKGNIKSKVIEMVHLLPFSYIFNMTSNLTSFLHKRGFTYFDGNSEQVPAQQTELRYYASQPDVKRILEIGFNAGHSADLFLSCNPNATVISFDLGQHQYVLTAKEYIDATYPSRHTLALGDSRQTVPSYIDAYPDEKFDLIFIDGGHEYDIAKCDVINCKRVAHSKTTVIVDDII